VGADTFSRLSLRAVLCCTASAGAADITINQSTRYQTIEGLGGFGLMPGLGWGSAPSLCCPKAFLDTLFVNMGVSIIRFEIEPTFMPSAGTYNIASLSLTQKTCMKKLAERGVKVIGTVWSPPCWRSVSSTRPTTPSPWC